MIVLKQTLGIGLTNYDTNQKDRERTLEILRFIYYDLDLQIKALDSRYELKKSLGYEAFIDDFYQRPITHLSMLDVMLNDSIYIEIIDPTLHIQIIDIRDSIIASITKINNAKGLGEKSFEAEWKLLKVYYNYMKNSIRLAMEIMLGDVKDEEIPLRMHSNRFYMYFKNYINLGYTEQEAFNKATVDILEEIDESELIIFTSPST